VNGSPMGNLIVGYRLRDISIILFKALGKRDTYTNEEIEVAIKVNGQCIVGDIIQICHEYGVTCRDNEVDIDDIIPEIRRRLKFYSEYGVPGKQ
jgi:hypothetical protein